ncbi:MAG TPA: DNA replication and repair protein RecF [Gemmatimonadaceae bacterium]|nr:DNA replication and repair protein RecF [Gemmatimonadaceae bacterium]
MSDAAATATVEPEVAGGTAAADAGVWLRRLVVRDFRNIARADVELPAEGVAIVGENGHGKTNLLEAVYYLELLRSARGARDQDLVRFGERAFHLAAEARIGERRREISAAFDRQARRKKVVVDGGEAARLSDALGALPSVLFSPRDTVLVAGAPAERRRFLDVTLALTSRPYLAALQHYRAALLRRNAALRDAVRGRGDDARIAVWEPALAQHGAVLWSARVAWVERWRDELAHLCAAIGERAPVRMRYTSALQPEGAVADALLAALAARRALDVKRGVTHAGPHRDDLELLLGERELRLFGSAGQQRTAALALRILEARTLREQVGAAPVLLLDDPFAELDARRARRILALLADGGLGQTLLAVPRAADIPPALTSLARRAIRDGVLAADGDAAAADAATAEDA